MTQKRIQELLTIYEQMFLQDVIPFWMKHSKDEKHGGYLSCLDRDGSVYHRDKYVWVQGRMVWMFSALYTRIETRPEWLAMATHGVEFLLKHCRDEKGHFYFHVTEDGADVDGTISIYSDFFAIYGLAEYARASGDKSSLEVAQETYWSVLRRIRDRNFQSYYPFPPSRL